MSRGHSKYPGFKSGNHWVVCDVCGFDYRSSDMRKRWDGLVVCKEDFELRHPQDFVRARQDKIAAQGLVRPSPDNAFVTAVCTTRSAVVGIAVIGCAIVGYVSPTVPEGTF